MVSTTTAVFPVCLSPITNSLCPLPTGIIASIALIPVCSGSFTGWRKITPGAFLSIGISKVSPLIGPFPSIGSPRVSITLPNMPSPTFIEAILLVRFTTSPSLIPFEGPRRTAPILSSSRFRTIAFSPLSNSINSPD